MATRETPTHSPAPWEEAPICTGDIYDAEGHIVAYLDVDSTEGEADYRLIKRAPDLLATCRAYVLGYEAKDGKFSAERTHADMKALVDYIDGTGET